MLFRCFFGCKPLTRCLDIQRVMAPIHVRQRTGCSIRVASVPTLYTNPPTRRRQLILPTLHKKTNRVCKLKIVSTKECPCLHRNWNTKLFSTPNQGKICHDVVAGVVVEFLHAPCKPFNWLCGMALFTYAGRYRNLWSCTLYFFL